MADTELIVKLYEEIFDKQKTRFNVSEFQIVNGMREIGEAYAADPQWENKENCPSTFYEDAADRCAYLHKYAMVHTGLLCDLLDQALKVFPVKETLGANKDADTLRHCSLGSGPGTDIVAFLFVLKDHFKTKRIHATLVDCCDGWRYVFEDIVSELKNSEYVGDMVSRENFQYEYVVADLLNFDGRPSLLTGSITTADVITMVKFVSAAACRDTRQMMERIFRTMKPGALLLFVDNAAGGFHEMVSQTAKECDMKSVFGPLRHYLYTEEKFGREYCRWKSQHEAKVTFEVWKKTESLPRNTTYDLQSQFYQRARQLTGVTFTDEDFPALDTVDAIRPRISQAGITFQIDRVELQSFRPSPESAAEMENNQKCCIIM